jgi:ribosomal protein L6P/L9E
MINKINKNIFMFDNMFFNKIKFKGKGFRVRFKKNSKILKFTFGHSHINYIFVNQKTTKIKRLGKYKYIFKNKNDIEMNSFLKKLCNIKPINMYTKRGIRLSRQIIYKRKGKKSTYI